MVSFLFFRFAREVEAFWLNSFSEDRNEREENDSEDEEWEVVLHDFKPSKKVAWVDEECRSEEGSDEIVGDEVEIFHFSNSCDKGCEGSHDRYKSCVDDGFPSVFVKEMLCFVEVFLFDEFFSEFGLRDFWSEEFSDFVIHAISEHCCDKDYQPNQVNAEFVARIVSQCTSSKKKRIPRQKRHNHDSSFYENNRKEDEQNPKSILIEKFDQMLVDMEDKVDSKFEKIDKVIHCGNYT